MSDTAPQAVPSGVRVLAVVLLLFGTMALVGSVFLWGQGFILALPPGVDYSFPVTDILVNALACFVASVGLWNGRKFGYIASQFVAGLFVYASVEIFVQLAQGTLSGPEILIPQLAAVVVAFCLVFYLWHVRDIFS